MLKVIKSKDQYYHYCDELESLNALKPITAENEDRIELLTVLIEKWDNEHRSSTEIHPVELLKQLMEMHDLNASELSRNIGIDKTVLSKMINHKKGFSKDVIRALASYFKVNQEAFNRLYSLNDSKAVEGTLAKSGQRT
jgi:HTH-type transcriptional regulator/antitoxin HigA